MNKLDVYFDFVEIGNDIEVGVIIEEDGEVEYSVVENFKNLKSKGNNFHFSLLAWRYSLKRLLTYIEAEGDIYDGITFYNQNTLIFTWGESGKYPSTYNSYMKMFYEDLGVLMGLYELELSFKTIKGKDNKVKKVLKKRKDRKGNVLEQKLSFNNIPNSPEISYQNNVIPFQDKKVN